MATLRTASFDFHISYGQAYLVDGYDELPVMEDRPDDDPEHPVGIIRVSSGPQIITVMRSGNWTVAFEDCGWRGAQQETLSALSRDGGEAVAVLRHDYAQHHVAHAVDGRLITGIDPRLPLDRQGADPDRLNRHLRELGIDPAAGDSIDNPIPAALALATRITAVMVSPRHPRRPILGAAIPGAR
ncbi:hypothetical protein HD597_003793 [Nonomuraea thailandensis]|uniref:Uncharacterized protein n=1 Tax=Nonomuraea thailandensis TaxID=1188745 RepID=A0A9X2GM28_9ACTN|nr:DUF6461 domain-containing protein [Nonomuraea thailandensis]MCP2356773.1 hypothetical protein [Nonomuraea thailandensis]